MVADADDLASCSNCSTAHQKCQVLYLQSFYVGLEQISTCHSQRCIRKMETECSEIAFQERLLTMTRNTTLTTFGLLAALAGAAIAPAMANDQGDKNNARNLALGGVAVAAYGLFSHNNTATLLGAAGAALAGSQYEKNRKDQSQDSGRYYHYNNYGNNNNYGDGGYDRNGYDRNGFNRDGYNHNGYNRDGYNRDGFNRDGFNRDGDNRNGDNQNRNNQYQDNQYRDNQNGRGWNGNNRDNQNQDNRGEDQDNRGQDRNNGSRDGDNRDNGHWNDDRN